MARPPPRKQHAEKGPSGARRNPLDPPQAGLLPSPTDLPSGNRPPRWPGAHELAMGPGRPSRAAKVPRQPKAPEPGGVAKPSLGPMADSAGFAPDSHSKPEPPSGHLVPARVARGRFPVPTDQPTVCRVSRPGTRVRAGRAPGRFNVRTGRRTVGRGADVSGGARRANSAPVRPAAQDRGRFRPTAGPGKRWPSASKHKPVPGVSKPGSAGRTTHRPARGLQAVDPGPRPPMERPPSSRARAVWSPAWRPRVENSGSASWQPLVAEPVLLFGFEPVHPLPNGKIAQPPGTFPHPIRPNGRPGPWRTPPYLLRWLSVNVVGK